MEDTEIYQLYWDRNEEAIAQTNQKYGPWCRGIALRILEIREEAEECVSDTYLQVWNNIPPQRPNVFRAWLGRITRNLALSRYRKNHAVRRGGGQTALALEELGECVDIRGMEAEITSRELTRVLNGFLASLPETERNVFLCRYWYMDSIETIACITGFSQSKVTSMLHRTRGKLRKKLAEEGYRV